MNSKEEQLEQLSEIRSLMERSTRFISLSGWSGIIAGIIALIGTWLTYRYMGNEYLFDRFTPHLYDDAGALDAGFVRFLLTVGAGMFIPAVGCGILLTVRRSKKMGIPIWDGTAQRLFINLVIPLGSGGMFILALLMRAEAELIIPAALLFYGMALFNAGKYTIDAIRYLGISEIALGILGAFFYEYALILWAIGFGLLHIVYGAVMYMKYER